MQKDFNFLIKYNQLFNTNLRTYELNLITLTMIFVNSYNLPVTKLFGENFYNYNFPIETDIEGTIKKEKLVVSIYYLIDNLNYQYEDYFRVYTTDEEKHLVVLVKYTIEKRKEKIYPFSHVFNGFSICIKENNSKNVKIIKSSNSILLPFFFNSDILKIFSNGLVIKI